MKKILWIGDTLGRVHQNHFRVFQKFFSDKYRFEYFTAHQKKEIKKSARNAHIVYYRSFPLFRKCPIKHKRIYGSATSWKCIWGDSSGEDMKILRKFHKISANNYSLYNKLRRRRKDIEYLPNGVDSSYFCPGPMKLNTPIRIGWVGNRDRKEKCHKVVIHLKKRIKRTAKIIERITSKSDHHSKLVKFDAMADFYRKLDFYLVTSSYEGTPNPALEAAACGIPIITTRVGNMPELINDGDNGFFIEGSKSKEKARNIKKLIKSKMINMSEEYYSQLSNNIRESIITDWDWNQACERFRSFFGD